ncbi:DUF4397 domain-containing protein [Alteromonas gilva]|uniref:DUF4397 domain-containing protein n=1 Tax=Alteromonas gilva TaxID=2987522 RepID=A0ABT5L2S3_9ALTE|nr:DUF4397 domain-containing protein [Alteromonas gilva]MDC8831350.1 DUF4397 domain-containing protein [Alteromonas gilva]
MKIIKLSLSLFMLVLLSACSGSDEEPVEGESSLRVVHASSDAPTVNVLADGEVLGFLVGVDYQQASEQYALESGKSYDFAIQANTTTGVVEVLSTSLTPAADVLYDVIAVGSVANETLELLTLSTPDEELAAGNARARIVHVAEGAPIVDIYVTAVGADLASAQPIATLGYKDNSGAIEVESGDYQIRITPAGSTTIAFDSGPVTFSANAELLVLATNNVSPGSSPVSLVISDGDSSATLLDKDTPASVRVVHGVADAPAVDILANNALELFGDASFSAVTDYATVAAGDYLIDVVDATDSAIVVVDDAAIPLEAGKRYTAIANNALATIDLDLVADSARPVATDAKVRLFHAASTLADVDIYFTADGNITDVAPSSTDIPYQTGDLADTGYVTFSAGDYIISVTLADSKTVLLETDVVSLQVNQVYTGYIVNPETNTAEPKLITAEGF